MAARYASTQLVPASVVHVSMVRLLKHAHARRRQLVRGNPLKQIAKATWLLCIIKTQRDLQFQMLTLFQLHQVTMPTSPMEHVSNDDMQLQRVQVFSPETTYPLLQQGSFGLDQTSWTRQMPVEWRCLEAWAL